MPRLTLLAAATAVAFTGFANAQDLTPQELQAQLTQLTQEVNQLKQQQAANATATSSSKPSAPAFEIGGRIQLDYNLFNGAYNAEHNGSSAQDIFPRRVRTFVEGELQDWDYKLLLEFAENTAEIVMARMRYSGFENGPKLQFGKLREDISLDALTSSNHIALIERSSLADTMSPYFRWGVSAYQYFPSTGLRYALGVYKNDAFGSDGKDETDDLNYALSSRVTWSQAKEPGQVLHAGLWYSARQMGGDDLSASFARGELRETNTRLINYVAGGETAAIDNLNQAGLELAFQHKALLLQGEYAQRSLNTQDPQSVLDGERYQAYYLQASYFLTGEQRSYSKGSAVFSQPKGVTDAWELAARFSSVDASSDFQGTKAQTYTLGVSYYFNPKIKVMANYIHSSVDGAGTIALVGNEDVGDAFAARLQYVF
ncbi:OprO/OprP family phosphate-selective porin [Shewanella sp. SR1]|uniref:OprO/OprP family phosphate-selective porin n=1 Tax=Shewanella sp. SR1 TaxID=2855505 RepID=UPI001CF32EBA|nr:porin [Shewanella sp. SR1]MCB2383874.1 OprO/OprP family phosphate-selective porin [Shewanella sp. SR1]